MEGKYLDVFIFRKLNKQKNIELRVVNKKKLLKLLVNNNQVNKVLGVHLNNNLLLLKLKNEKLNNKLRNLNVNNVKSSIHYQFLPLSHKL
jgi:hypothetical protein